MRRIFLFSLMIGASLTASALPLHLTTHLRNVSPEDCERVIAKIAETESKDRDLKNQMDEVPQCISFFTERLTKESIHDKDYRKGCAGLLPDFCQQNRYLSLQTVVEKYKTNKLKLLGSMSLGFMYGKNAVTEVKRIADRFKKSTGGNAKSTKSQGEVIYEENKKLVEECPKRDPKDCILSWKIEDPACLDETKASKVRCQCIPDKTTDDYDPTTKQCGKHRAECLANNGKDKTPLEPTSYFGTTFNPARSTNETLHILKWNFDKTDPSHGIKGCYIEDCMKGYARDQYHLKCEEGTEVLCLENNNLNPGDQMVGPYAGATKSERHIDKVDYRAGSAYGIQSCFIVTCTDGYKVNQTKSECISEFTNPEIPTDPNAPQNCSALNDGANGDGEDVNGYIFGGYVRGCRLVCKRNLVATSPTNEENKKCEKAAEKCTGANEFKAAGKLHDSFYGWEFDDTKSPRKCEPLCKEGFELNPEATTETPVEKLCLNPNTPPEAPKGTPEYVCAQKEKTATVEKWKYVDSSTKCTNDPQGCVVAKCKPGTYPAPDLISCIPTTDPEEESCLERNFQIDLYPNVCGWSYVVIGGDDVKGTCFPDKCTTGKTMRKWLVNCDGRTNEACVFHCSTKTYPGSLENYYMNTIKSYCEFKAWDGEYDDDCTNENRDSCKLDYCNFLGD